MIDYQNLPGLEGEANRPGLMKNVFVAPVTWFTTIQKPTDSGAMDGSSVVITTDHAFDVGKGFIKMYTTLDSAQTIAETIGERDGRGHRVELTAFRPGMRAIDIEFGEKALSDEFIILVETLEGNFYQLGSERLACECTAANGDTGTVSSGRKGYTFTFETFAPIRIYEGDITEKPVA